VKWMSALLITLLPTQGMACSCIPIEDLSPSQLAKTLRDYPIVVRAGVASTEYPAACRIAPLRWFTRLFSERTVEVRHTLAVKSVIKGKPTKRLTVVQEQWIDYAGCVAPTEAACEINFKVTDDLWILRPSGTGTFRRANLCSSMIVIDAMAR